MTEPVQDLFISHASKDKAQYVQPLADSLAQKQVTFWLDSIEIGWGDSVPLKINEGLRLSRYVLLCLSRNFLQRPWPEAELASALMAQNSSGRKRVLPLILNSKEMVLNAYPLLASVSYREFKHGVEKLAGEIAAFVESPAHSGDNLNIVIESVHTGKLCNIAVSPRVSLKWLAESAQNGLGVSDRADTGAFEPFMVKWVLVDTKAEEAWLALPRRDKRGLTAVVSTASGPKFCTTDRDRLTDLGVTDGTVFHLYAVEDERYDPPPCAAPPM
jgi:hypothetical protein